MPPYNKKQQFAYLHVFFRIRFPFSLKELFRIFDEQPKKTSCDKEEENFNNGESVLVDVDDTESRIYKISYWTVVDSDESSKNQLHLCSS